MKKTIIIAAIAAMLASTAGAFAGTTGIVPHIFGGPGKHYVLDSVCHRPTFAPPGLSIKEGLNVTGQQVWCLIRRKAKSDQCVKDLGPVPSVVKGHTHRDGTSDWSGVDALQKYLADFELCVTTK